MQRIRVEAVSAAAPEQVFALLADGSTWPQWGVFDEFALEERAPGGGEGVGALRRFTSHSYGRRIDSRERVTELVPGRRLSYRLVSGLPLRDYRATVDLEPTPDGGTRIRWSSDFSGARVPGTAWLYRRVLESFIQRIADDLAAAAARPRADAA